MKSAVWANAIRTSADPSRVKHHLELLAATPAGKALAQADAEQARILAALLSGSEALGAWLVANPAVLAALHTEALHFPRQAQGLRGELNKAVEPLLAALNYAGALAAVRQFKQREMLRIATRDLAHLASLPEIIREISDVADVCLASVWRVCRRQLKERHGEPYYQDAAGRWQRTEACVLGLGKLGGQELNYSSDVDLLFVYSEEGQVFKEAPMGAESPRTALSSHQFFNKLAEAFIAEVTRLTADGALYRVDMRLRPEGDAGPLARSLPSYENYYAQWGQTWERMMLIKARGVAGEVGLAAEFLETIQSFRYPRSINESVLDEVAVMKERIEQEVVKAGELNRNVKLGRGGIREIEFIVQGQQLLQGGHQPFLQSPQTLPTLEKLAQYRLLSRDEAKQLRAAYCWLRDVEHRLQMEANRQTHSIPEGRPAQQRLAALMNASSLKDFEEQRIVHAGNVRRIYDRFLKGGQAVRAAAFPAEFAGEEEAWKKLLLERRFRDPDKAFRMLQEFVEGPGYVHVSARTSELARKLLGRLFNLCPGGGHKPAGPAPTSGVLVPELHVLSDPDRVVTRLDSFISAYGARATLFEIWHSNPSLFDLLVLLFDRSEFLAEVAIRTPDLIDEQVISGRLRRSRSAADTLEDLRHGRNDADQHSWLRRYHQAEQMRIGLRDILGLADPEQCLTELSSLADACLRYALEVVLRKHALKTAPFAIIGLGKLGGEEIDYGSDLDVVFVADARARDLTRLQRVAADLLDLVSRRTEHGAVFHMDARLRPDGEKGMLVNTLAAYEEYYRRRAQLWEIQSISRTRFVAGDARVGEQFRELTARLTDFKRLSSVAADVRRLKSCRGNSKAGLKSEPPHVGCYDAMWKQNIHQMRMRIEKERTPAGKDDLAIKTGKGGLVDAEFIAQALCQEHGWQEANTLRALERGRAAGVLPDADKLIENYRRLRRVEGILRRWSYEGEIVLPDDPAPYYRVSVRCGFPTPEAFRAALASWRVAIRQAYLRHFGAQAFTASGQAADGPRRGNDRSETDRRART
jgi:glutamate-ammonia-ligase adenylyltransferase